MRDEAMLRKVGDTIAAEPKRYDQWTFGAARDCGTVACVAGHAAMLHSGVGVEVAQCDCGDSSCSVLLIQRGTSDDVFRIGAEALGLTDHEAFRLFDAGWLPAGDPSVPLHERVQAALYALADGASIEEVTA